MRRLQARIAKAAQAGKWGKVKALQRLLTHSFGGKALAVRRVTENQGKRTAGVDGVVWDTPEKKATAIHSLKQHGYHPLPLRRVYIEKQNGKAKLEETTGKWIWGKRSAKWWTKNTINHERQWL